MDQLLTTGIPYIIAAAFLGIVYTFKSDVVKVLQTMDTKAKQVLGQTAYDQAKTFAIDTVKYLLQQYPESTIEDIIARAAEVVGTKFGINLLSEAEIKAIIVAAISEIQQNLTLLNDTISSNVATAQQKYLSGVIQSTDRKQVATDGVLASLKQFNYPVTDDFKPIIDNKIESAVLSLKTPEEQNKIEGNILQSQVSTLSTAKSQLEKENLDLTKKLSSIQVAIATSTAAIVNKSDANTNVTEESTTVIK